MTELYVVGVYEDFNLDVFPTHALPIVAERSGHGFRRWSYVIERPYRLRAVAPIGEFRHTPALLFPVVTFHLCPPQRLLERSQVIALSKKHVLVEHGRLRIVLRLLLAILANLGNRDFVHRACRTIRNAW
jgi:hypothetical protein